MIEIEQAFEIARPPADVFAFMVDPGNLAKWQTIKTGVEPLTDGPPRQGYRVRESNRVGMRKWDQVVEFTEFDPPRAFAVKVVEGPESTGRWTFEPGGAGTLVQFKATAGAPRLVEPLFSRVLTRQFRGFHENLRRELEAPAIE